MAENPYQSPREQSTQPRGRRRAFGIGLLSLLAVPAAAIAGGTTCTAVVRVASLDTALLALIIGVALGMALAVGILLAADWLVEKGRHEKPARRNYVAAASRLSLATPLALVAGAVALVFVGEVSWNLWGGDSFPLSTLATGITAFAVWSTSFWRGLRSRRDRRNAE